MSDIRDQEARDEEYGDLPPAEVTDERPADDFDETIYCEMLSVLADKAEMDLTALTGFLTPQVRASFKDLLEQLVDRSFRLGEAYAIYHEFGSAIAAVNVG